MRQVSIAQLRKLLKERGEHTDDKMNKEHLANMLKDVDKNHWEIEMKQPLPKKQTKGNKSTKDIAEDSLKALGVKGIK